MRRRFPAPRPLLAALAAAGLCSPLHAQTAGTAAADDAPQKIEIKGRAEKETATGPVEGYAARRAATATKTDTPLGETPQSVTVVTEDQITDLGATNIVQTLNYAAGVRGTNYGVDSRGDWARIRGAEPTQYLDGLQLMYGFNNNTRVEPFTLERIDVLRGPASVLYGQGSTGGLINMVSKRPLGVRQNEIGLQLGNYGRVQLEGDFTGPLTEDGQWLYRLVALGRNSNTQVDFVPDDAAVFAPSLTWAPDNRTRWTLQYHWQRNDSGSSATFLPWSGTVLPNPNGRIPVNRFVGEPSWDTYETTRSSLASLFEHRFDNGWLATQSTRWTYSTGNYETLYPSSNFADPQNPYLNPEQSIIGRYAYGNRRNTHTFQADQNLLGTVLTGPVAHQLLFGFDYSRYAETAGSAFDIGPDLDVFAPVYGNFTPPPFFPDPKLVQQQIGVYVQDQLKFGRDWLLMLGARSDWLDNELEGADTERDQATTGRVALMYLGTAFAPYLSWSQSFMPTAGTDFYGQRFVPTRGEQWELGLKYQNAPGTFVFNGALYSLTETNRLVNDPANPQNQLQTGQTRTKGVELEAKGQVTRSIDIIANYIYTDIDESLEQLPKNMASVWGTWRFAAGDLPGGFKVGLGVRYASAFTDGFAPETPSVTLADALLAYETRDWRVALNATNLFDKTYVATCLSRGDCWWGAKRQVVASVAYRF